MRSLIRGVPFVAMCCESQLFEREFPVVTTHGPVTLGNHSLLSRPESATNTACLRYRQLGVLGNYRRACRNTAKDYCVRSTLINLWFMPGAFILLSDGTTKPVAILLQRECGYTQARTSDRLA